jgi:AP-3 complex subunit delta-1
MALVNAHVHPSDSNLLFLSFLNSLVKYLGLLAMGKILTTNPKPVQAHKDLIMQCLDDKDESIRLRALDLLYGMVCIYSVHFVSRASYGAFYE